MVRGCGEVVGRGNADEMEEGAFLSGCGSNVVGDESFGVQERLFEGE